MRNWPREIWRRLSPSRRVVTLEINSTGLRLLEVKRAMVTKWASQTLEPGMFENEVVTNPRGLSRAIRHLMKSSGTRTKKITASVSGLFSLSRVISIPVSPTKAPLTREAVIEKAREVLPISEEELYISWQTLNTTDDVHHVLVVGVPKETIDGEVKAVRAAGMRPAVLGLKAMALVRAVNRQQALILNIEPTTIDIILVRDSIAESMYTTAWQSAGLSLEDSAEHLAVTLELTVGAYNSNHPGSSLDAATPLYLTGELSEDLKLAAAVHARVGYSLESLSPPLEHPPHLPVSQYAVNLGLAVQENVAGRKRKTRGDLPPPLTMNLLPHIYLPWKPTARQVLVSFAIVAIIVLLYPAYNLITEVSARTTTLKTRYDLVKGELSRRQAELARREPMQKFLGAYQTIVDMGGGFIEDMKVIDEKAGEFGIEVPEITHGGDSITITARAADNYTAFRNFVAALRESGRFVTVTSPPELYPYPVGGQITLVPLKK